MTHGKRIVAGALIAVAGAFVWALVSFAYWYFQRHNPGETVFDVIVYAAYAVFVASWFVLPMGAVLGAAMPRVVRGCSQRRAFVRGALLGICVGAVAAILTVVFIHEWPHFSGRATMVDRNAWRHSVIQRFTFDLVSMSLICCAWVGVWAVRWSRRTRPAI